MLLSMVFHRSSNNARTQRMTSKLPKMANEHTCMEASCSISALQSYFIPGATHPRPEQHYVEHKVGGERKKARRNHCMEHHLCG